MVRGEAGIGKTTLLQYARDVAAPSGFRVESSIGSDSETQILFLVAPKTGGRPQLLRFDQWQDKAFVPADVLPMPGFEPTTRTITSYRRYGSSGVCGHAGEWTWSGTEFKMTGYWDKPDCNDDTEFARGDKFRIFPLK